MNLIRYLSLARQLEWLPQPKAEHHTKKQHIHLYWQVCWNVKLLLMSHCSIVQKSSALNKFTSLFFDEHNLNTFDLTDKKLEHFRCTCYLIVNCPLEARLARVAHLTATFHALWWTIPTHMEYKSPLCGGSKFENGAHF